MIIVYLDQTLRREFISHEARETFIVKIVICHIFLIYIQYTHKSHSFLFYSSVEYYFLALFLTTWNVSTQATKQNKLMQQISIYSNKESN